MKTRTRNFLYFLFVVSLLNTYFAFAMKPQAVYAAETLVQKQHSPKPELCEEKIAGKTYQVCRALVNVKADKIWHIITDYDNAAGVFPCLKKCKLIKENGNLKHVEQEVKPSGLPGSFGYLLEIKETASKYQEWHRLSGDFKEVDGFWKLEPVEDGAATLVTYASRVDGGFFMPQALIKRQQRAEMPGVLTALKLHAETTRHIAGVSHKAKSN